MMWKNPFWRMEKDVGDFWPGKKFMEPDSDVMMPAADMFREDGSLVIKMDMPGVEKDKINVKLVGDCLCVSANKSKMKEDEGKGYYTSERVWKAYGRTIRLPVEIDPEKIKAKYMNGTLKIEAPIIGDEEEEEKMVDVE
jgi:HSP20 family protein